MIAIFLGVAFPVHEFAHAYVAYLRGDATAKLFGRLTLNPIVHFDPVGGLMTVVSIFLGGFLIGWAKPTPVNTNNLRNRRNDEVLVALAGPASNLVMAAPRGDRRADRRRGGARRCRTSSLDGLFNFVVFNVMLSIFNLIPIPPLDGSTLLYRFLPPHHGMADPAVPRPVRDLRPAGLRPPRRPAPLGVDLRCRPLAHGPGLRRASSGCT